MIYSIVEAIKETALKHKGVMTFKYQDKLLTNAQPNNQYYEVIVETDGYFKQVKDVHTLSINMSVLGFVDKSELETQDICSQIGLSIINKVCQDNSWLITLIEYSILLFTKRTDDSASGARFTIELAVPSFIDWCSEQNNWLTDEEYEEKIKESDKLNLGEDRIYSGLDLKPADLR